MIRKKFHWNFKPDDKFFDELWKDADFVFDTNIFINLYKYGKTSTNDILDIFKKLKGRIWLPYQVGIEFTRNLRDVLYKEIESSNKINKDVSALANKLKNEYNYELKWKDFEAQENKKKEHYKQLLEKDTIIDKIATAIGDCIGEQFDEKSLLEMYKEGKLRYDKKIPPGYGDKKEKPEPDCYGDLVIWKEILRYAKDKKNKPIIFITEDHVKDDWFELEKNEIVGPARKLREEFSREVSHSKFWIYRMDNFIEYAEKHLNVKVKSETKSDIKSVDSREYLYRTYAEVLGQKQDALLAEALRLSAQDEFAKLAKQLKQDKFTEAATLKWDTLAEALKLSKQSELAEVAKLKQDALLEALQKYKSQTSAEALSEWEKYFKRLKLL